jgi:hypothetical protein
MGLVGQTGWSPGFVTPASWAAWLRLQGRQSCSATHAFRLDSALSAFEQCCPLGSCCVTQAHTCCRSGRQACTQKPLPCQMKLPSARAGSGESSHRFAPVMVCAGRWEPIDCWNLSVRVCSARPPLPCYRWGCIGVWLLAGIAGQGSMCVVACEVVVRLRGLLWSSRSATSPVHGWWLCFGSSWEVSEEGGATLWVCAGRARVLLYDCMSLNLA